MDGAAGMTRLVVALCLAAAVATPALATASTPVRGGEKEAVIGSVAEVNNLDPLPSPRVVGDCWTVRSYDQIWAAATYSAKSEHHVRECNQTADYQGQRESWQPDVSILRLSKHGWSLEYEFDETTTAEANRHGIPTRVFNALVNRQLFQ
jgi:hypothetical protein